MFTVVVHLAGTMEATPDSDRLTAAAGWVGIAAAAVLLLVLASLGGSWSSSRTRAIAQWRASAGGGRKRGVLAQIMDGLAFWN